MNTYLKTKLLVCGLFMLGINACGDNCVECITTAGTVEFCDDLNYTDQDGNKISFDEFVENQLAQGINCN